MLVGLVATVAVAAGRPAQDKGEEAALEKAVAKADLIVVAKVVRNGLSGNSNRDIAELEVKEVLLGDAKTKTTHFVYASPGSGGGPKYGKVGTEGVWILTDDGKYKEGDLKARGVLLYRPAGDLDAVKKAVKAKTEK
jgi:hypothetical protein